MAEEHFAALRPRRSDIITPENSPSPSISNFRQYNQHDLHTAVVAVKPREVIGCGVEKPPRPLFISAVI